jgi:release factor glutamine methyltransferase
VTTVATALADARRRGVASLDAQLLLARLLATTRTRLIAHDERPLTPAESARWEDSLERRLAGEPVAYLLGEKEFHGWPSRSIATCSCRVRRPSCSSTGRARRSRC